MWIAGGILFLLLDEKSENQLAKEVEEKDKKKKEKGPSLVTKIIVADTVLDALDNKKDDKKK